MYLSACNIPSLNAAVDCYGGGVVVKPDQLTPRRPVPVFDMTPNLACPLLGLAMACAVAEEGEAATGV